MADCLKKIDLGMPSGAQANTTGKKRERQMAKKGKKSTKKAAGKFNSEPNHEPPAESGASEAAQAAAANPSPVGMTPLP